MLIRTCKQCGKQFGIDDGEIQFYKSKNLSLPKRCKECRQSNKLEKDNQDFTESYSNKNIKKNSSHISFRIRALIICFAIFLLFVIFDFLNQSVTPTQTPNEIEYIETDYDGAYQFRSTEYLQEHFEKHGSEFGYTSAEEYLEGANRVINADGVLHKLEAEDGDDVYYLEHTNELVIISTDGYIRTYFKPNDGIEYYNRQ